MDTNTSIGFGGTLVTTAKVKHNSAKDRSSKKERLLALHPYPHYEFLTNPVQNFLRDFLHWSEIGDDMKFEFQFQWDKANWQLKQDEGSWILNHYLVAQKSLDFISLEWIKALYKELKIRNLGYKNTVRSLGDFGHSYATSDADLQITRFVNEVKAFGFSDILRIWHMGQLITEVKSINWHQVIGSLVTTQSGFEERPVLYAAAPMTDVHEMMVAIIPNSGVVSYNLIEISTNEIGWLEKLQSVKDVDYYIAESIGIARHFRQKIQEAPPLSAMIHRSSPDNRGTINSQQISKNS